MQTPILTTPRLVLRPVSLDDAPAIQRGIDDWNVIRELSTAVPWPYPADGALTYLQRVVLPSVEAGSTHYWVITAMGGDGEAMGAIEFRHDPGMAGHRGFWLAHAHWGQGWMSEAAQAVEAWLFLEAGVEELILANAVSNVRSRRVKEKSGAERMEEFEFPHHHGDNLTERWRLTKEQWLRVRESSSSS